jgi:DNA-binding GntR family transcriptional regulator
MASSMAAQRHTDLIGAMVERYPRSRARSLAISREHWGIIAAVRAQDEELAARLVMEHVQRAGQHLAETMQAANRQPRAAELVSP